MKTLMQELYKWEVVKFLFFLNFLIIGNFEKRKAFKLNLTTKRVRVNCVNFFSFLIAQLPRRKRKH